jgi:hypothetical protein
MAKRKHDFPCLNELYGVECEYPFCSCEAEEYENDDRIRELPEIFADENIEVDFFLEDFDEDEW